MSSLVQDAICTETSVPARNFADARINPQVLQEILKDLDEEEVISIIFLMVDKDTNFSRVIADIKEDPRTAFTRLTNKDDWTDKLLESLLVIKNKYVLEKMAFDQKELKKLEIVFATNQHNVSSYVNKAIKSLYFLCENLNDEEVIKLVTDVNDKLFKPVEIDHNNLCLELYILEWLNQKYISIDPDNCDLSILLKNLKVIGCSVFNPSFNFDYWENHDSFSDKNEQDSQACSQNFNYQSTSQCSSSENSLVSNDPDLIWTYPGHKKLCIIVNEINFRKHSTRKGSEIDERTLRETFEGCGFEVRVHNNCTKQDMIALLDTLNSKNESYSTYGAIFICILSHGLQGEVVCSDDDTLSIPVIRQKFCCKKLHKVFKFLILQSCQGKQDGMVERLERRLVTDGPCDSYNPLLHMHFGLFQATVRDYSAMRHEEKGTWFIQDLCQEIREANGPLEIRELIRKVKDRVSRRKARCYDHIIKVQLPESTDTITIPYEIPKFERENIKFVKIQN